MELKVVEKEWGGEKGKKETRNGIRVKRANRNTGRSVENE